MNVDTILMQEMGRNPYEKVKSYGNINLYHVGFERNLLNDALEKFKQELLIKVDDEIWKVLSNIMKKGTLLMNTIIHTLKDKS